MKKRSSVTFIRSLLLVGAISLVMSGAATFKTLASDKPKAKEGTVVTAEKTKVPALPPIDAGRPTNFQTASFGLG